METLEYILGIGDEHLNWWQMSVRAVIVFFVSLTYIRLANKRIFGQQSTFDIVLSIMYGSIMSRAITGTSPFFPTLAAGIVLILLHRMLASVAFQFGHGHGISNFLKGKTVSLVKDGKVLEDQMRAHSITENDIIEVLRTKGGPVDIAKIETACLERSGSISVVYKDDK
ncbi:MULTISPECIES: DUF421 domain-containing protein [Rufibacter]|uniref:DUF421 domain-containing protein n=1 Tax=Rufibacter TaxID=1379908 RepID=UPI001FEF4CC2|nr:MULTISPECIES: YetF domain-containing protein [Rufibacter]